MAITEFVFPRLNPDPVLLEELKKTLPSAAKATFSDVPGLLNYYRGRVVRAQNLSEATEVEHSGLVIVLEWDKICSFNEFWQSDKFASFRNIMAPYLLDGVSPDLFSSDTQEISGATTTQKYTQYIKVSGIKTSDNVVETAWQALMSELEGQMRKDFRAWGVQDTKGIFAGMIGWDSLEAFEVTTEMPAVKELLRNIATNGAVSSYLLELEKQS